MHVCREGAKNDGKYLVLFVKVSFSGQAEKTQIVEGKTQRKRLPKNITRV